MNNGIVPYLAMAFAIPLLMLLVRVLTKALSDGVGKPWAWFLVAFVFVLAGEGTGLLQSIGIDPRAAMKGVLLCGLGLVLIEDCITRALRWL